MYLEPADRKGIKTWYYDFTLNKKRYRGWLKPADTMTRAQAKAAIEILRGKILSATPGDRKPELSPKEVLEQYRQYIQTHRPKTYLTYQFTHKSLIKHFGRLVRITDADIVAYQQLRMAKGRTGATINRDLNYCNAAYNRALRKKLVKENPFVGFDKFKEEPRTRYLTEAEMAKLLGQCEDLMRDVVLTAILTGLRKQSILRLHADQIDFEQSCIHITGEDLKNGKSISVPIPPNLSDILREKVKASRSGYVFENPETGKPFTDMKRAWRKAVKAAGLKDLRFHDLRHTFATYALLNSRDLRTVQELLGHKDMRMTQRYTHVLDKQKRAVASQVSAYVDKALGNGAKGCTSNTN